MTKRKYAVHFHMGTVVELGVFPTKGAAYGIAEMVNRIWEADREYPPSPSNEYFTVTPLPVGTKTISLIAFLSPKGCALAWQRAYRVLPIRLSLASSEQIKTVQKLYEFSLKFRFPDRKKSRKIREKHQN